VVSERTCEREVGLAERFLWMLFAPFEFIITILVGVPLFLCQAALIYLRALRSLFVRAAIVFILRFRTGRIFRPADKEAHTPPTMVSESIARGPFGLGRFNSWLN
jgi:hypothetical protein